MNISKIGRWAGVVAVATTAIGLTARDSSAYQYLFSDITTSNANCVEDPNNNYFVAEAYGYKNGTSTTICSAGISAEIVDSYGYGSTASSTCAWGGQANQSDRQIVLGLALNTTNGQGTVYCAGSTVSFTSNSSCSFTAPVTSNCPSGTTISAASFGKNYTP